MNQTTEAPPPAASPVSHLVIHGMTCHGCAQSAMSALQKTPGVDSAEVDLDSGRATVRWREGSSPDPGILFQAVRRAGYEPENPPLNKTELRVAGMTCSGCARNVADALRNVPGVAGADVDLEANRAVVEWLAGEESEVSRLISAVQAAGYEAETAVSAGGAEPSNRWSPFRGWLFNVVVGTALTAPLFILEWGFGVGERRWYGWLAFALTLPVQTLCGARFYRGAWNQLKVGGSNMDTLVVLGSTTAFAYSSWALFSAWPGHLFFMESGAIITLISVGHWVEAKVSARAARSLRALLNLAPQTARILDPGGAEVQVPVASVRKGDQVVVKPGDRIPLDGEVVEGASAVDESMLTGESAPVNKSKGVTVYGGTVNRHGWLLVRVTATGETTALAQIIRVVQRAQSSRATIQKLGDRVSSVFVPIVVLVALATGLWWGFAPHSAGAFRAWLEPLFGAGHPHLNLSPLASAIYHAAAVLIVACPCAMGLATPAAIMAGTNVAAERGILIRDGLALEKTGKITAVLFDKTGTITEGRLALLELEDFLTTQEQEIGVHKIVASIAKLSLHPLSQAVSALSSTTWPVANWQEVQGAGVQANLQVPHPVLQQAMFRLGSLTWLREAGVDLDPGTKFVEEWSSKGATLLGVAADQRLIGLMALRDLVKPDSNRVIQSLKRQGKSVYLVTGDNPRSARAIAELVGIPEANVFAEIRPEAKAGIVERLQTRGERVAFVGDGINDAPALERADLGIAVARASDVAREAADVILLNSDIHAVPEALAIAQATLRTIKQNLFWAFFYNVCSIPLAVFGFLSPVLSAFAMGASDVLVIGNALRLRRWRFRPTRKRSGRVEK